MNIDLTKLERGVESGAISAAQLAEVVRYQQQYLGYTDRLVIITTAARRSRRAQPLPVCAHTAHDQDCMMEMARYYSRQSDLIARHREQTLAILDLRNGLKAPAVLEALDQHYEELLTAIGG